MVCCSFGGLPPHTSKSDRCVCCKRYALLRQEYIMLLLHFARRPSPAPPLQAVSMRSNACAACALRLQGMIKLCACGLVLVPVQAAERGDQAVPCRR